VCVFVYRCVLLEVCVFTQQVGSYNNHDHVHTLGAELVQTLCVGHLRGRVYHSQPEVRLRPLPPEIFWKISTEQPTFCFR